MKERKGRGKEREVPTLLIENSELSHAAHVTKTHSFPKGGHPEYCLVCLVHGTTNIQPFSTQFKVTCSAILSQSGSANTIVQGTTMY